MAVRPLAAADCDAAAAVVIRALPPPPGAVERRQRIMAARCARCLREDPAGAWVAERDGQVAGLALALRRGPIWVLSMLAVDPDQHGAGFGGRLLARALEYGADCPGGMIAASTDPRALRLYFRAGFELRPTMTAAGVLRTPPARDPDVRRGGVEDLALCAAVDERVRGGARTADLAAMLDEGRVLYVLEDRGYAITDGGVVSVCAGTDEDAAGKLLATVLAEAPAAAPVEIRWLTQGNDWAFAVVLEAGLTLEPDGPIFTRGELGPMRPYLPSGAFL